MKKEWKDIKGFEYYQVSNYGEVMSYRRKKHRMLKATKNSKGYLKVGFYGNGKPKTKFIHQLVAEAFLGHKPCGMESVVDHIDNNPLNNRLDNLQITTARHNVSKDRKGIAGVSWNKSKNKWQAHITIEGRQIYLGYFLNYEGAVIVYKKALENLHIYEGHPTNFRTKIHNLCY